MRDAEEGAAVGEVLQLGGMYLCAECSGALLPTYIRTPDSEGIQGFSVVCISMRCSLAHKRWFIPVTRIPVTEVSSHFKRDTDAY